MSKEEEEERRGEQTGKEALRERGEKEEEREEVTDKVSYSFVMVEVICEHQFKLIAGNQDDKGDLEGTPTSQGGRKGGMSMK